MFFLKEYLIENSFLIIFLQVLLFIPIRIKIFLNSIEMFSMYINDDFKLEYENVHSDSIF